LTQSDPTDSALAAIASILDQPFSPPDPAKETVDDPPPETPPIEQRAEVPAPIEANGYSKVGPGPMAAIRFKWTVREQDGEYFVDETFGENARPIVSGPMDAEAAIKLVDARESAARKRFEDVKRAMTGRSRTVENDEGEDWL